MDMEELMQRYPNVSRVEIEKIRKTKQFFNYDERRFVSSVDSLNKVRENEKINGRKSVEAGPIVELLSVQVIPSDKLNDRNKPLVMYGRIYVEYRDTYSGEIIVHDLFNRRCDDAQVLGPSGGPLTLVGPDRPCRFQFIDCTPVNNNTRLVVDAFIGEGDNLFAEKQLCCDCKDMTNDLEKIELDYVHGELCSLALHYIVMPFAVYAHVNVDFVYRKNPVKPFINVKGKIVARYGNNLNGSKCTLFEKLNDNEFERVEKHPIAIITSMRLTRCWLGVPVTSSLILDFDLSEFGTGRKILKETIELRVGDHKSDDEFIVDDDDILIRVHVGWCGPPPQGRLFIWEYFKDDDDDEILCNDEQMDEASCVSVTSSSILSSTRILYPPDLGLYSFVEIFSVFIGRENYKPMQVYGSIQVSSKNPSSYVFKRETRNDAFYLQEHSKILPVLDGSRDFDDVSSLKMKIDLKDVENQWHIKGYVKWSPRDIEYGVSNQQLCSVIQGQDGNFAAIHYTIFSAYTADYARVGLLCVPKNRGHFRPKVYGSLVAQYDNYDYTTRYNKDYYRIVLFQRNRDDAAQPGPDGFIPLSRSMIVVTYDSSIVIEANIGDGLSDELSFQELLFKEGNMDTVRKNLIMKRKLIMERNDYSIYMYVKWE